MVVIAEQAQDDSATKEASKAKRRPQEKSTDNNNRNTRALGAVHTAFEKPHHLSASLTANHVCDSRMPSQVGARNEHPQNSGAKKRRRDEHTQQHNEQPNKNPTQHQALAFTRCCLHVLQ